MHILGSPAWMILIRVKTPAKHKMLAVLITILLGSNGLPDHFSQLPVGLIATFVRGFDIPDVCLNARQGHPSLTS
jgi:hypothetical protein